MPLEEKEKRLSSSGERALWEELHKINLQLEEYKVGREAYRPKIDQLIEILTVSKGLLVVIKAIIYVGAPVAAVIYWAKEHIK